MTMQAGPPARSRWKARLADPMVGAVVALGITQITAWGTSYYCLGVLAGPIAGTPAGAAASSFSASPSRCSRWASSRAPWARDRSPRRARGDDARHGARVGRPVRAVAMSQSEAAYLAVWAFLGVGMRLCLYDAAFAALVQVVPSRGRHGDFLPDAVRRVRLVRVLGGRPRPERARRLAADARAVRHDQSRRVPAAALVRPGPARDHTDGAPRCRRPRPASPDGPPLEGARARSPSRSSR